MDHERRIAELERKFEALNRILLEVSVKVGGIKRQLAGFEATEYAALGAFFKTHPQSLDDLDRIERLVGRPKDDRPT
jgi:hypothetical protein